MNFLKEGEGEKREGEREGAREREREFRSEDLNIPSKFLPSSWGLRNSIQDVKLISFIHNEKGQRRRRVAVTED